MLLTWKGISTSKYSHQGRTKLREPRRAQLPWSPRSMNTWCPLVIAWVAGELSHIYPCTSASPWQDHPGRCSQDGVSRVSMGASLLEVHVLHESLLQATGIQSWSTPRPPPTQVSLLVAGQTFLDFPKNPKENTSKSTVISETKLKLQSHLVLNIC